jgi:hypothetical protein
VDVQAHHGRIDAIGRRPEAVKLVRNDAKLGLGPGCPNVSVMPMPLARIHTHEEILVRKDLRILYEGLHIVECHVDAPIEGIRILLRRGKIRLEQNALRIEARDGLGAYTNLRLTTTHDVET